MNFFERRRGLVCYENARRGMQITSEALLQPPTRPQVQTVRHAITVDTAGNDEWLA